MKSVDLAFTVPPNIRTDSDLLPIIQVLKNSKIFNQFEKEPEVMTELASKMELVVRQSGE